jgi:hypothetical protein
MTVASLEYYQRMVNKDMQVSKNKIEKYIIKKHHNIALEDYQ